MANYVLKGVCNLFKRLFCKHKYKLIEKDGLVESRYSREWFNFFPPHEFRYECEHCHKKIWSKELQKYL
jgi:hypothetical protein